MKLRIATLLIIAALVCVCLTYGNNSLTYRPAASSAESDLAQRAIQMIAERNHISAERLSIANEAPADFPLQEISVSDFKIAENVTGETFGIALNPDASEVSIADLVQRERDLYLSRYGKMAVDLAEMLDKVSPDEPLQVNIL